MAGVQGDSVTFVVNTHDYIITREEEVKQKPDQL